MSEKKSTYLLVTIAAVGFAALVVMANTGVFTPKASAADERAPGSKRWPGLWKTLGSALPATGSVGNPDVTIDIDVAMFQFNPAEIRVKKGQVVKLRLHGMDDGQLPAVSATETSGFTGHGFQIMGPYDVWVTGLRKDVTKEVVFLADTAGTFDVECAVFCGLAHPFMRGKLVVEG